jgi:hypothetical protein
VKSRVAALLLLALTVGAAHAQDARDEKITLTLDNGQSITATVRRPSNAAGRLPALMLFGGVQRAAKVLDLVKVDRPVIWATFDYPYEPPRKFRFPSSLQYVPEAKAAIHGTFDGVVKLHEALRARPDVDPARITVIGASAGAPFATVGAARTDIPGVILVQGFSDVVRVWQNLMIRKRRAKYGDWIQWPALWLSRFIHWYCEIPDIAAHARQLRPTQKVLLFNTIGDDYIPAEASDPLWAALEASGATRERILLTGKHLGVGDDSQLIADILQRSLKWMDRNGLL